MHAIVLTNIRLSISQSRRVGALLLLPLRFAGGWWRHRGQHRSKPILAQGQFVPTCLGCCCIALGFCRQWGLSRRVWDVFPGIGGSAPLQGFASLVLLHRLGVVLPLGVVVPNWGGSPESGALLPL